MPQLNPGQQAAADTFVAFLFSDDREMILSGPAGVGKSFTLNYLINDGMRLYAEECARRGVPQRYWAASVTATTNKAAEVIQEAMGQGSTVHSFLNLRVSNDYSTGESRLDRTGKWRPHQGIILAVDECSMIDSQLWRAIQDATIDCKILYLGDHCQMAPVKETLSPIYAQRSPIVHLTQPVRNAGQPALVDLCSRLRHAVDTDTFAEIREVPGVIDVIGDEEMELLLDRDFRHPGVSSRILAYTNKRVHEYARHIREYLRDLGPEYVEGEPLVVGSAYKKGDDTLSVEQSVTVLERLPSRVKVVGDGFELPVGCVEVSSRGQRIHVEYPLDRKRYDDLLKHYKRLAAQKVSGAWRTFYNLQEAYADLRPAEACTVYKAQGSTYDSVYVDLNDLSTCTNPNQAARMLYVAISRARSHVILYGDLVPRLGGPVIRA